MCCCFHLIRLFDVYEIYNTFRHLDEETTYKTFFFSILPWQGPTWVECAWYLQKINMALLFLSFSMISTFTGCLAFYVEAVLKILTEKVRDEKTNDVQMRLCFNEYQNIFCVLRELNKWIGKGLFAFYFLFGAQQGPQTYCIFQILRSGGSLEDVKLLFTDMMVSFSTFKILYH